MADRSRNPGGRVRGGVAPFLEQEESHQPGRRVLRHSLDRDGYLLFFDPRHDR